VNTFVDSGAWYAYLVPSDPDHPAALAWMAANRAPLLTTDYVIDETLTMLRARGHNDKALHFGTLAFAGRLTAVRYLTPADIAAGWQVFHRFRDKEWSFTDCASKVVIELLGIPKAFSFDHHFRQFGTVTVVP
jgi:uncharacterized protein